MTSNKILTSLVVLALLVIGAVNLSGGSRSSQTIVIGSSLPLTGPSASLGERVKNAMDLALNEVNEGSEKKFSFSIVYEDDKGDSKTTVSAVTKLIESDGVHEIIGLLKSDPLLAAAPIIEKHEVVLLSPTAGAAAITNAGDFIFRNLENPDAHGKVGAQFFLDRGVTKAAIFSAKASNALSYANALQENYERMGGKIVFRTEYSPDATDFRTELTQSKDAQAIYIGVATAKDAGLVIREARELGFNGTILASVAAEAKELIDTAGAAAEGVFISSAPFDPTTPIAHAFADEYVNRYGKPADGFAANGYDALHLLVSAIMKCGDAKDTHCVRDFLYATKDYPGAGGLTSFDKNGDVTKIPQIKVVRNGQFVKT